MANGHGGARKGAGRPPGLKNEKTMAAREAMDKHGYNPIEALVVIAKDDEQPTNVRMKAAIELMKYHSPQLKAVDINANVDSELIIQTINYKDTKKEDLDADTPST